MVQLAADSAVLPPVHCFGVYLPLQIHLQAAVDGCLLVVLPNDVGIIYIVNGLHLEHGIVVDKLVKLQASRRLGADTHAGINRLFLIGNDAGLNQLHHRLSQRLRVNTQVFFVHQVAGNGIGKGADSQLYGRPVLHQAGAVVGDLLNLLAGLSPPDHIQGRALLHNIVRIRQLKEAAAGKRHIRVYLGDDPLGRPGRRLCKAAGISKAAHAVFIRRRHLNQGPVGI